MRIRTWTVTRSVIVGGALGLITATVVIFGFVVSHRTSIATTTAFADVEFSRLRARFMNQEPLVDMSRREASRASAQSVGIAPTLIPYRHFRHSRRPAARSHRRAVLVSAPIRRPHRRVQVAWPVNIPMTRNSIPKPFACRSTNSSSEGQVWLRITATRAAVNSFPGSNSTNRCNGTKRSWRSLIPPTWRMRFDSPSRLAATPTRRPRLRVASPRRITSMCRSSSSGPSASACLPGSSKSSTPSNGRFRWNEATRNDDEPRARVEAGC